MAIKVKRDGKGLEDVIKRLEASAVEVGIHQSAGMHDSGELTVATVGAINEYGGGNVPERSFLRSTLNENRKKYIRAMAKIAAMELDTHMKALRQMGKLGRLVEDDIKMKIVAIRTPPNAESTKARKKGADNPLVDNGQLLNSIRWKYAKPD